MGQIVPASLPRITFGSPFGTLRFRSPTQMNGWLHSKPFAGILRVTDPTTIRMSTIDYDGDGDTTEGIKGEMDTLAEALYASILTYASEVSGVGIVYDPHSNPYFFVDADGDGEADLGENGSPIRFSAFTPRLMEAAYNYQYSQKDPGAYVHNGDFVIQFLIDSIEDLGGDVTTYTRPDTPSE